VALRRVAVNGNDDTVGRGQSAALRVGVEVSQARSGITNLQSEPRCLTSH
jgi:hypothetical protein